MQGDDGQRSIVMQALEQRSVEDNAAESGVKHELHDGTRHAHSRAYL